MKAKFIASLAFAAAALAAGGIHLAFSQDQNTEACFVKGRAYCTGASACLAISTSPGIEHTCEASQHVAGEALVHDTGCAERPAVRWMMWKEQSATERAASTRRVSKAARAASINAARPMANGWTAAR